MWRKERNRVISLLKKGNCVIVIGDGRCDSPGHSAKYCTYTLMDAKSGHVVDTVVVPVTDVANSNAMEKAGFIKTMMNLKDEGVVVDTVSTDRHTQIRKLVRTDPRFKGNICSGDILCTCIMKFLSYGYLFSLMPISLQSLNLVVV